MSDGGPFRELFVEVPMALLEAAVIKAQTPTPSACAVALHTDLEYATRMICREMGLELIDTLREAASDTIVVRVRMPCRHVGRFFLDETVLVRKSVHEIGSYIFDTLEAPPWRKCTCIEYVPPPVCTPRSCK